jgi:hypothetical protein
MIGDDYHFIETQPISAQRLNMGWGGEDRPSYILQSYVDAESKKKCQQIIDEADVVIIGSAPYCMVEKRLKNGCPEPWRGRLRILLQSRKMLLFQRRMPRKRPR